MRSFIRIVVYCLLVNSVCAQEECRITASVDCNTSVNCDGVLIVETGTVFQAGACNITAKEIIIDGTLKSGSGKITCDALTINGSFELIGKGNVVINGDVVINGTLNNKAFETIEIGGNLTCNGELENIIDGKFKLLGVNKGLYGKIRALSLEVVGSYTNNDTVEIRNTTAGKIPAFFGSGTFTQAENALLITRAPSTSKLIAAAKDNTVRFVRNGNITINCAEFYNVECSTTYNLTKDFPVFTLDCDATIYGSLQFTRRCFLNLNGNSLIFPKWTENSLLQESLEIGGIILDKGAIIIDTIEHNQTVHIPLYHSTDFKDFAHVEFTNNDNETTDFSLSQLLDYIPTNDEIVDELPYIPVMYEIASQSKNSTLSFYWHSEKENPTFDHSNCRVVLLNNGTWEPFGAKIPAQSTTHKDIYYISTNYVAGSDNAFTFFCITSESFLPICLTHFSVNRQANHNVLTWKTASERNCDYFIVLKSLDGLNFSPCARIAGNGTTGFEHSYSFCDKEQIAGVMYYQLAQYDYNGALWKSNIITTPAYEKSIYATLIRKSSTQCVVQTMNYEHCFVSDGDGRIVAHFPSNTLYDFSHLTQGIYFVNAEHSKILDNCLIVR